MTVACHALHSNLGLFLNDKLINRADNDMKPQSWAVNSGGSHEWRDLSRSDGADIAPLLFREGSERRESLS